MKRATPQFKVVDDHKHLCLRDNGIFYIRLRVPRHVRGVLKKTEIRKSLHTNELDKAIKKKERALRDAKQEIGKAAKQSPNPREPEFELTPEIVTWLSKVFFIRCENERLRIEGEAEEWTEKDRFEAIENTLADWQAATGTPPHRHESYRQSTGFLDAFLEQEVPDLLIKKGSKDYKHLLQVFRLADGEYHSRLYHSLKREAVPRHHFPDIDAHTEIPPRPKSSITLGSYKRAFLRYQSDIHENTTANAYRTPLQVLTEVAGDNIQLRKITRQHVEETMELLSNAPRDKTKLYPGVSYKKAIRLAQQNPSYRRLTKRTLGNYLGLMSTFFRYACGSDFGYLEKNPADSKKLRALYPVEKHKRKEEEDLPYTDNELRALFSAPLYTGCKDDSRGYAEAGPHIIRRGRFWVPLLALFHGLRLNEACQLYVQDIKEVVGIPYIVVRGNLDDADAPDKHVKNFSSWRSIPLHPEVIKMGFLDYVEDMRSKKSERLFPDLRNSKSTGRFSHVFSKWFSNFKKKACGYIPKGNFHSFRSHFSSRLDEVGVKESDIERFAGWLPKSRFRKSYLRRTMPYLLETISKLNYPQLNLAHLYVSEPRPPKAETGVIQGKKRVVHARIR